MSETPGWAGGLEGRADDEIRTRDIDLGKVALYQLSYIRMPVPVRLRPTQERLPEPGEGSDRGQPWSLGGDVVAR